MYRGNLASLTTGVLRRLNNQTGTGSAANRVPVVSQPRNNFYSYTNEPSHTLFRSPTIVSVEEAVKCIQSGKNNK